MQLPLAIARPSLSMLGQEQRWDRIDRLISSIQRQLETRGDEVTTSQIGEAVMDGLKTLDHVAYIRFASVYKDFSEPGDFAEIAGAVGEEPPLEKPKPSPPDRLL